MSSSATVSSAPAGAPVNSRGKVLLASLIGTSIEFYDFYIYATAAVLVFPQLFFPEANDTTALLSSFAVFGAAFLGRPLGSVLFGHFGDRIGRKATLVASLLTMGIATFLIGCLPTALTPGWAVLAPLCLALLRFAQGVGLGGEWSGAALLATENAPANRRAVYGTFPQLGAPIGFVLANVFYIVLGRVIAPEAFAAWGWRLPFLASAVLVLVGLWVRLRLVESPAFTKVVEHGKVPQLPMARVFRTSFGPLVIGTVVMIATYVLFYLMTAFVLSFGTAPASVEAARAKAEKAGKAFDPTHFTPGLGYAREEFLMILVFGVVFFGLTVLISGPLAERFGRRPLLLVINALIVVFGLAWVPLFGGGFAGLLAAVVIGFTLMGLTFGPMGALLPELFPSNVRYTGSAFSYNAASILGAAVAPFIAVFLWEAADGSPLFVGLYLSAAAVISLVGLVVMKETREVAYADHVGD